MCLSLDLPESHGGYMSVLVDVEEVRALVRGPDKDGLTGMDQGQALDHREGRRSGDVG